MKLTDFRIGTRLGAGFTLLCAMLVVVAALGVTMMARLDAGTQAIVEGHMPMIDAANRLRNTVNDTDVALRNMMLSDDPAERRHQVDNILARRQDAARILGGFAQAMTSPADRAWLDRTLAANTAYVQGQEVLFGLIGRDRLAAAEPAIPHPDHAPGPVPALADSRA